MKIVFAILVFLGLIYGGSGVSEFKLAQLWPASFCSQQGKNCISPLPQQFIIHGLWPEPSTKHPLIDLNFRYLLPTDMESMEEFWTNLEPARWRQSEDFWKHEWTTHGVFSGFSARHYFQLAIKLRKQFNMLAILENADIKPNGSSYDTKVILRAITGVTIQAPDIECSVDSTGQDQFFQIFLCVSADGKRFISCKGKVRKCKTRMVTFPAPPPPSLLEDEAEF